MANESDVVLNFKMDGQIEYATTIKEINQVMNTAAKEYKNHISAMGNDASATDKLTAAKRKLEIQLEGAEKRTRMLREEYEKSAAETGENSEQTKKLYDKLLQAETAENNLRNSLERTNNELANQGEAAEDAASKIEKIEDFLTSKRNYLFKIVKYSKEQYLEINEDRINFVTSRKEQYLGKIKDLEKIKEEI